MNADREPRLPLRRLFRALAPRDRRDEVERDAQAVFDRLVRRRGRAVATLRILRELAALLWWRLGRGLAKDPGDAGRISALSSAFSSALRDGSRSLRRRPATSLVAVAILGVAVGAGAVVLSLTRAVLYEPLPYDNAQRLLFVTSSLTRSAYSRAPLSGPELDDLRRRTTLLDEVAGIWATAGGLVGEGDPTPLRMGMVTANFFGVLGVRPALGRWFDEEEEGAGRAAGIVLSHSLWRDHFDGDPSVLGRQVRIDGGWGFQGGSYQVLGVAPRGLVMSLPADAGVPARLDAWVPFGFDLADGNRGTYYVRTLATRKPQATIAAAREEVVTLGEALEQEHVVYAATGRGLDAEALQEGAVRAVRPVLLLLLGSVAVLVTVAYTNVAALLTAVAAQRQRELQIRQAIGASANRLRVLLCVESILLSLLAAAVGLGIAAWLTRTIESLLPDAVRPPEGVVLDASTAAILVVVAAVFGMTFGAAPAFSALRFGKGLPLSVAQSSALHSFRWRRSLLVLQVALAFVLVVGSGLLQRTTAALAAVDAGYDREGVMTFELNLPLSRYDSRERMAAFAEALEEQLQGVPGVSAAGAINQLPLSDVPNWSTGYRPRGAAEDSSEREADARLATPGYFAAMGARLVAGRLFDRRDRSGAEPAVVVDELLAARAWPGVDPLGRELEVRVWQEQAGFQPVWARVVGVVRHMRLHDLSQEVREQVFVPMLQYPRNQIAVAVRFAGDPTKVTEPVREALARVDPHIAMQQPTLLEATIARATSRQRWASRGTLAFALFALLLAAVGLYSVLAHEVHRRRSELALRLALGARPRLIVGDVLARGLLPAVAGLIVGLPLALVTVLPARGLFYGVQVWDPLSYATAVVTLLAAAALACLLPSLRAMVQSPNEVLKES